VNVVILRGKLSRAPVERVLPSGDILAAYEVTIPHPTGRAESVPVSWPHPGRASLALAAGEAVVVVGRVRRRFYRAGGATQSRTEVVATEVVPARQRRRAGRAVERALDQARESPPVPRAAATPAVGRPASGSSLGGAGQRAP
jgi:single-strand DNA-binding protein